MPYIRIVRGDAIDEASYEACIEAIDLYSRHPLGLMLHAAGEVDGCWQIVSVWESKWYADQFDRKKLEPAMTSLVGDGFMGREITGYEVKHLVTP